ncbi:hypothetical protein DXO052_17205, partial [Xanthomonas oryzae pv. oryzae]
LKRMMKGRRRPIHLVLDGLPAHKTRGVRDDVDSLKGRLTLHFLPGDAPDLNPDEIGVELHQAHGRGAQPAAQWREAGRSGA